MKNRLGQEVTFEQMATDHAQHQHCSDCEGCILDPLAQLFDFVLCAGCRDKRIKSRSLPKWVNWQAPTTAGDLSI